MSSIFMSAYFSALQNRRGRAESHHARVYAALAEADDLCHRGQIVFLQRVLADDDGEACAVIDAGGISGSNGTVRRESGTKLCHLFRVVVRFGCSSVSKTVTLPLRPGTSTGTISS